MKKFTKRVFDRKWEIVTLIIIFILVFGNIYQFLDRHLMSKRMISEVSYQPPEQSIFEPVLYPGRAVGDYSDRIFNFDVYLNTIGATEVHRNFYTSGDDMMNYELRFKLDGNDWTVKTTEYRTADLYTYGMYSGIEVDTGRVKFKVPTSNYGSHISDSTSAFKMDWVIFGVFHNATDSQSELAKELRMGIEESNCPFRGLGIVHYELWPDDTAIWHDDAGDFMVEDGLDLNY